MTKILSYQLQMALDKYEVGLVINALNEMRNKQIARDEDTTFIDEVLIRIIDTPFKKKHVDKIIYRFSNLNYKNKKGYF